MKKTLIAALVSAASVGAFAQSSVTLFGVVDLGIAQTRSTGAGHVTGMIHGGHTTSRLGFRGTEDLGGGLAASYWLEGELQPDAGNSAGFNFMRRSTVSLSGPFGEVRLGRDLVAGYLNMVYFEPWLQRGLGSVENFGPTASALTSGGSSLNYIRNSNMVAYLLPATLGGVYGSAQYAFGERNSTQATTATNSSKQGDYFGGRLGYAKGPVDVAASYGKYADVSRAATYVGDYSIANIGASYDFGPVRPMVLVQTERLPGAGALPIFRFDTYALGAVAIAGLHTVRASVSYYDNRTAGVTGSNDATKVALGYVYALSKRTALYADIGRVKNKGSAAFAIGGVAGFGSGIPTPTAGGSSTGVAIGVKHSF